MHLFYWFTWMLWIMITFFLEKGQKQTYLTIWVLSIIIGSVFTFTIAGTSISGAYLFLLLGFGYFQQICQKGYTVFATFTICLGYVAVLFWSQLSPIWIFIPKMYITSFIMFSLTFILGDSFHMRLGMGVIGITLGEIYHGFIMTHFGVGGIVGGVLFWNTILVFIMTLMIVSGLVKLNLSINAYIHKQRATLANSYLRQETNETVMSKTNES